MDHTRPALPVNNLIDLMESALGMNFSDEQKAILRNSFTNPVLVNACAGSGKTTVFILLMFVAVNRGIVEPDEILGITFSHQSRHDMELRYTSYAKDLADVGLEGDLISPTFDTFHSLFFHLLQTNPKYQSVQVLESYTYFSALLASRIEHLSPYMSKTETLQKIFELNNYLINRDLTDDGILPRGYENFDLNGIFTQMQKYSHEAYDKGFYQDYITIVNYYQELKVQNGMVDFNDMKILLAKSLQEEKYLQQYRSIMERFKLVLIDEFQDIDNLQWKIIIQLLNKTALKRLLVIGDDDQSIYSFRGSNPQLIIYYQKIMPNVLVYNLSTNYRTCGRILATVVQAITTNKVRLSKSLLAFKEDQGQFNTYQTNVFEINQNSLLKHLIAQINDPKINNQDIAVLVRYNSARTVASDWLANQDIFVNLNNNRLVLQNNSIYRIFIGLVKAFWNDRFKFFHENAHRIGFRAYEEHVDRLKQTYRKKRIVKLKKYVDLVLDYTSSLDFTADEFSDYDLAIVKVFQETQTRKAQHLPDNAIWLLKEVTKLTEDYFRIMEGNNFISKNQVDEIRSYLEDELANVSDLDEFFTTEDIKKQKLTNKIEFLKQKSHVQFMSIHQAKGLEFKYVYLYQLTDKTIKQGSVIINKLFPPDISFADFLIVWQKSDMKALDSILVSLMMPEYNDHRTFFKTNSFYSDDTSRQAYFELYQAIIKYSELIEEERRLIYVGITRAETELNLDLNNQANPLLYELALPNINK